LLARAVTQGSGLIILLSSLDDERGLQEGARSILRKDPIRQL
jgi:hypothetical protein